MPTAGTTSMRRIGRAGFGFAALGVLTILLLGIATILAELPFAGLTLVWSVFGTAISLPHWPLPEWACRLLPSGRIRSTAQQIPALLPARASFMHVPPLS